MKWGEPEELIIRIVLFFAVLGIIAYAGSLLP